MEHIKERWGLTLLLFFLISCISTFLLLIEHYSMKKEEYSFKWQIQKENKPILYNYHTYSDTKIKKMSQYKYNFDINREEIERIKEANIEEPRKSFIYHKVEKGETLWKIARLYDVSLDDLILYNNIDNPDLIYQGSILKILSES